VEVII